LLCGALALCRTILALLALLAASGRVVGQQAVVFLRGLAGRQIQVGALPGISREAGRVKPASTSRGFTAKSAATFQRFGWRTPRRA
jgi:hypothetical protein